MDKNFLKAQAERCRSLAENADQFTRKRLLDLADTYELRIGKPSAALRILQTPINLPTQPKI